MNQGIIAEPCNATLVYLKLEKKQRSFCRRRIRPIWYRRLDLYSALDYLTYVKLSLHYDVDQEFSCMYKLCYRQDPGEVVEVHCDHHLCGPLRKLLTIRQSCWL